MGNDLAAGLLNMFGAMMQSYTQSAKQNEEKEYKKMLAQQAEMKFDEQKKKNAALQNIISGNPGEVDFIIAGVDPIKYQIAKAVAQQNQQQAQPQTTPGIPQYQGMFGGGNPLDIPQDLKPQATFKAADTGAPKWDDILPGLGITMGDVARHQLAGASPLGDTVRTVQTVDAKGTPISAPMTRGGNTLLDKGVPLPPKYQLSIEKDVEGRPVPYYFPERPQLDALPTTQGQPAQSQAKTSTPGVIEMQWDTSKPNWKERAKAAIDGFQSPQQPSKPKLPPTKTEILMNTPVGDDATLWLDRDGNSATVDMKVGAAQSSGMRKFDAATRNKIMDKIQVIRELEQVYPLMEAVYGKEKDAKTNSWKGISGRAGDYGDVLGAQFKTNADAALLKAFWDSNLPGILKGRGQSGTLSDQDIKMGKNAAPDFSLINPDTPDIAWRKFKSLREYYVTEKEALFGGKGESKQKPSLNVGKSLDAKTATSILQEAGGDKARARQIAIDRGYKF